MNRLGAAAETRARQHLEAAGLRFLEQNFQCRLGEIDLIMQEADELVMIEVRSRAAKASVSAAQSITGSKRRRIIQATRHWLSRHPQHTERPLRFDVIAIDGDNLDWIRNAFDAL